MGVVVLSGDVPKSEVSENGKRSRRGPSGSESDSWAWADYSAIEMAEDTRHRRLTEETRRALHERKRPLWESRQEYREHRLCTI